MAFSRTHAHPLLGNDEEGEWGAGVRVGRVGVLCRGTTPGALDKSLCNSRQGREFVVGRTRACKSVWQGEGYSQASMGFKK